MRVPSRLIRRLRPISTARPYRQAWILYKLRILKRKFAQKENRPAIGLHPARVAAAPAEAGVEIVHRVIDSGRHEGTSSRSAESPNEASGLKHRAAGRRRFCGSRTCKPNSVRLAAGRSFLWATHYCGAQATYPEVVARRAGTRPSQSRSFTRNSLPIWSCSVWGLPCPLHYCRGGALLPHLFTLTPALPTRRYVCLLYTSPSPRD